jgi:hypothetical protein
MLSKSNKPQMLIKEHLVHVYFHHATIKLCQPLKIGRITKRAQIAICPALKHPGSFLDGRGMITCTSFGICLVWDKIHKSLQYHITGNMCGHLTQVMAIEGACFVVSYTEVVTEKNATKCKVDKWQEFVDKLPGGGFLMMEALTVLQIVLDKSMVGILMRPSSVQKFERCALEE